MKQLAAVLRTCLVIAMNFFFQALAWADTTVVSKEIDVNLKDETGGGFYVQPWMWVAGAAVFILILVAIIMRGRNVSKTKIKSTEN